MVAGLKTVGFRSNAPAGPIKKVLLAGFITSSLVACGGGGGGGGGSDSSDNSGDRSNSGSATELSADVEGIYDVTGILDDSVDGNVYMGLDADGFSYFYIAETESESDCFVRNMVARWRAIDGDTIDLEWISGELGVSRLDVDDVNGNALEVTDVDSNEQLEFTRIDQTEEELLSCEGIEINSAEELATNIVGVYDVSFLQENGLVDVFYYVFKDDGTSVLYDYLGDEFDDYADCYYLSATESWQALDKSTLQFTLDETGEVLVYDLLSFDRKKLRLLDVDSFDVWSLATTELKESDLSPICDF